MTQAAKCQEPGCTGSILDGYCDVCGTPGAATAPDDPAARRPRLPSRRSRSPLPPARSRSRCRPSPTAHRALNPAAPAISSTATATSAAPRPRASRKSLRQRAPHRRDPLDREQPALGDRHGLRAGPTDRHQGHSPSRVIEPTDAGRPARRRADRHPAGARDRRRQRGDEGPGRPGGQAVLLQLRHQGGSQPRRPARTDQRVLPQVSPGLLLRPQAQGRRPRRGSVRRGRLPRPRRAGLDLPRPRPERLGPLGRPQGPAQHR